MKKIVKLLIIINIMIMSTITAVNASTGNFELQLNISEEKISSGQEFDVILNVANNEADVYGLEASLDYDKDVLELVASDADNNYVKTESDNKNLEITASMKDKIVIMNNNIQNLQGQLVKIKFKAKENISKKDAIIAIREIKVVNQNFEDVKVSDVEKTIKINNVKLQYIAIGTATVLIMVIIVIVIKKRK